jgi:hypothetical protein
MFDPTMANYTKVDAVDEYGQRGHFMMPTMANIPDDIAIEGIEVEICRLRDRGREDNENIAEVETEIHRLRVKTENRRLKVAPKLEPVAPPPEPPAAPHCAVLHQRTPPGLSAPPGLPAPPRPPGLSAPPAPPAPPSLSAPPSTSLVGHCQVSKESAESLKKIEDCMKFFNNQSGHILNLIKAQGEQFKVQSGQIKAQSRQIEAQSRQIKAQSEQLTEMRKMLTADYVVDD